MESNDDRHGAWRRAKTVKRWSARRERRAIAANSGAEEVAAPTLSAPKVIEVTMRRATAAVSFGASSY